MKPCPDCGCTSVKVLATYVETVVFTFHTPTDSESFSDGAEFDEFGERPEIFCENVRCQRDRSDEFEFDGTNELRVKEAIQ